VIHHFGEHFRDQGKKGLTNRGSNNAGRGHVTEPSNKTAAAAEKTTKWDRVRAQTRNLGGHSTCIWVSAGNKPWLFRKSGARSPHKFILEFFCIFPFLDKLILGSQWLRSIHCILKS